MHAWLYAINSTIYKHNNTRPESVTAVVIGRFVLVTLSTIIQLQNSYQMGAT